MAKKYIEPGDILGVKRLGGIYEHYAVYIGNNEIIHYAGRGKDFSGRPTIHKAHIKEFLGNNSEFFILEFPDEHGIPERIYSTVSDETAIAANKKLRLEKYHLYSPEETVGRAKSRLGENEYSLVFNNCEHFAIWCKTGISESYQVNRILKNIVTKFDMTLE